MSPLRFENGKITGRRLTLILMALNLALLPAMIKILTRVSVLENKLPEGLYADQVAAATFLFSHSYLFIPVWILILVGQELSDGHVNRVVFTRDRAFYFRSKLYFCGWVTVFFWLIGLISLVICLETAPFPNFTYDRIIYLKYSVQMLTSTFAFTMVLLCVVFLLRSPIIAFVAFFLWGFAESIIYMTVKGIFHVPLYGLPFHFVRTSFMRNGEVSSENYYNPIFESPESLVGPTIFLVAIVLITRWHFMRRDLKPLSD